MNRRERILALTALAVVILAGGGFLFKFLFLDALASVNAQIADAQQDLQKKDQELTKEAQDERAIVQRDPRLLQWQKLSLPENKNEQQEIKSGLSPEEVKKHHEDQVEVQYERFLNDLVVRSGFAPNSIKVSAAPADRKGAPTLSPKVAAYTRMSFTVQGQARLDAVERLLEDFHKAPLLHQVRNLTLTARQQIAPRNPTPGAAPGAVPGAFTGAPGGVPGVPGGVPAFTGGNPAAPGGVPAFPGVVAGPGGPQGGVPGGDLDVNMTVDALLVTGAEKRDKLLPDSTDIKVHTLADSGRQYSDMLAKNIFTGIAAKSTLTEDREQVLAAVRLTSVWNTGGRRWQATIWDQGKGTDEKRVKLPVLDEFSITDKYNNVVVKAKVLKCDEDGLVFLADGKYYRWRCGEFLGRRLRNPENPSDSLDDKDRYLPGVLEAPLTSDQLKELGLPK